jgi:hypothetical protein
MSLFGSLTIALALVVRDVWLSRQKELKKAAILAFFHFVIRSLLQACLLPAQLHVA